MGVYIKGMEMPKDCWDCSLSRLLTIYAGTEPVLVCSILLDGVEENVRKGRDERCPLVEVPPHGDLIDQGAAVEVAMEWCPDDDGSVGKIGDLRELLDEIEALPTIIEVEE